MCFSKNQISWTFCCDLSRGNTRSSLDDSKIIISLNHCTSDIEQDDVTAPPSKLLWRHCQLRVQGPPICSLKQSPCPYMVIPGLPGWGWFCVCSTSLLWLPIHPVSPNTHTHTQSLTVYPPMSLPSPEMTWRTWMDASWLIACVTLPYIMPCNEPPVRSDWQIQS